jgi:uncharacterized protein YbjT (DUF2867 family)
MAKTALIAGATGLVGKNCLEKLLQSPAYDSVIAVTRRPLGLSHPKLQCLIADFNKLEESAAKLKADDVYCCLGTTIRAAGSQEAFRKVDYTYVVEFARLARRNGAQRFLLVSAVNAKAGSRVFYSRTKGEAERDVAALGYSEVHIFRPSFLLGERPEHRPGESVGIAFFRMVEPFLLAGTRRYRSVQAADVAGAMVNAAQMNRAGVHRYEHDDIERLAAG